MMYPRHYAALCGIALCLMSSIRSLAQPMNEEASSPTGYEVTQIKGLPEAKPNIKGRLTTSDTALLFANPEFKAEIPTSRITSASAGEVRIETGGKAGRVARTVIPFGGGLALATVTQRSAELLTIEYVDVQGGYHGAVFFVPKFSAKTLNESLSLHFSTTTPQPPQPCEGNPSSPSSIIVEPIASRGIELPAEYRVLLYEGLIDELRDSTSGTTYFRAGSSNAETGCSAMKLKVTVTGFRKGNQALRASTGPIGLFVGKTSVSFHVDLTAADGHQVLEEDMTNIKRMDTESLGVAKSVGKAVAKKIHKLPANRSAS